MHKHVHAQKVHWALGLRSTMTLKKEIQGQILYAFVHYIHDL